MLNTKAQVEDNLEYVICFLLIIIGVVALTILQADSEFSSEQAKESLRAETSIQSFETSFMGTDLLNIMKISMGEQTLGEALALIEQESAEAFVEDAGIWSCRTDLYTTLHAALMPVYGENWYLTMENEQQQLLFACTGVATISYQFLGGETNTSMQIPSLSSEKQYTVELGVLA